MTTPRNHETVAAQAREWRYKVQFETLGAPTTEHDFGFWDDERVAAFIESRETVESTSQFNLLAQALGEVLQKIGVIRDLPLTGPELLTAAKTFCDAPNAAPPTPPLSPFDAFQIMKLRRLLEAQSQFNSLGPVFMAELAATKDYLEFIGRGSVVPALERYEYERVAEAVLGPPGGPGLPDECLVCFACPKCELPTKPMYGDEPPSEWDHHCPEP